MLPEGLLEAGVDALPHPGQGLAFAAQRQAAVGLLQAAELLHRAPEAVNALLLERADGDDPGLPQALVVVGVLGIAVHAQQAQAGGDLGLRARSEEHTSELQSQSNLVCRLLLEKKKILKTDEEGNSLKFTVKQNICEQIGLLYKCF